MVRPHKILHGVPAPKVDRSSKQDRRKFRLEEMEVDDYILVPGRTTKSLSAYISRASKAVPGKFVCRPAWMMQTGPDEWALANDSDVGAVSGSGVWRTE